MTEVVAGGNGKLVHFDQMAAHRKEYQLLGESAVMRQFRVGTAGPGMQMRLLRVVENRGVQRVDDYLSALNNRYTAAANNTVSQKPIQVPQNLRCVMTVQHVNVMITHCHAVHSLVTIQVHATQTQ